MKVVNYAWTTRLTDLAFLGLHYMLPMLEFACLFLLGIATEYQVNTVFFHNGLWQKLVPEIPFGQS
jgi:hypothetical protein